jgi:glycosyltransferase involved in cell wall biosynthesis
VASEPVRVLFVASHPVQYASPLFRRYSQDPRLDVTIAYCSLEGSERSHDPDFDTTFAWDVSLLGGYPWELVPNRSPRASLRGTFGLMNTGLWSMIRPDRFDLIVSYLGYRSLSAWIVITAARHNRVPLVLTLDAHELRPADAKGWKVPIKKFLLPWIFSLADGVFAASTRTVQLLYQLGVRRPVYLTPLVVDTDFFRERAAASDRRMTRRTWGVPEGAFVALFAGKLVPWKRPADLLEAIARSYGTWGVFAGDGPLRQDLEARAERLGVADRVRFLGFKQQTELPDAYAAADLLVLPSESETFGVVVNEMFAAGHPAVVSEACGSAGDLVREGETGFVVKVGDVHGYAEALDRLVGDRHLRERMSKAAAARLETWGPANNVDAVVEASRELAAK